MAKDPNRPTVPQTYNLNLEVRYQSYMGIQHDGTVSQWYRDADGNEDSTVEHLSKNPRLQSVFGEWVWDTMLDPRA